MFNMVDRTIHEPFRKHFLEYISKMSVGARLPHAVIEEMIEGAIVHWNNGEEPGSLLEIACYKIFEMTFIDMEEKEREEQDRMDT